ncbi:unnamed protein product [Amoebophrya sp. A25]|nr:unnamed protein product [Amoebophrya sp. A25]|eukprot:GSA25T00024968001.1
MNKTVRSTPLADRLGASFVEELSVSFAASRSSATSTGSGTTKNELGRASSRKHLKAFSAARRHQKKYTDISRRRKELKKKSDVQDANNNISALAEDAKSSSSSSSSAGGKRTKTQPAATTSSHIEQEEDHASAQGRPPLVLSADGAEQVVSFSSSRVVSAPKGTTVIRSSAGGKGPKNKTSAPTFSGASSATGEADGTIGTKGAAKGNNNTNGIKNDQGGPSATSGASKSSTSTTSFTSARQYTQSRFMFFHERPLSPAPTKTGAFAVSKYLMMKKNEKTGKLEESPAGGTTTRTTSAADQHHLAATISKRDAKISITEQRVSTTPSAGTTRESSARSGSGRRSSRDRRSSADRKSSKKRGQEEVVALTSGEDEGAAESFIASARQKQTSIGRTPASSSTSSATRGRTRGRVQDMKATNAPTTGASSSSRNDIEQQKKTAATSPTSRKKVKSQSSLSSSATSNAMLKQRSLLASSSSTKARRPSQSTRFVFEDGEEESSRTSEPEKHQSALPLDQHDSSISSETSMQATQRKFWERFGYQDEEELEAIERRRTKAQRSVDVADSKTDILGLENLRTPGYGLVASEGEEEKEAGRKGEEGEVTGDRKGRRGSADQKRKEQWVEFKDETSSARFSASSTGSRSPNKNRNRRTRRASSGLSERPQLNGSFFGSHDAILEEMAELASRDPRRKMNKAGGEDRGGEDSCGTSFQSQKCSKSVAFSPNSRTQPSRRKSSAGSGDQHVETRRNERTSTASRGDHKTKTRTRRSSGRSEEEEAASPLHKQVDMRSSSLRQEQASSEDDIDEGVDILRQLRAVADARTRKVIGGGKRKNIKQQEVQRRSRYDDVPGQLGEDGEEDGSSWDY